MSKTRAAPPSSIKAVLFDLDGTLIDTAEEFVVAVQALRADYGKPLMETDRIRASVSNGAAALVGIALDFSPASVEFADARQQLLNHYSAVLGSVATLYPGLDVLLTTLEQRGIGWGIATNKPRAYAAPLLQALGLANRVGSLVCPDDVKNKKPHPEALYLNCQQLDCRPGEAIYVGDHLRDIEAGRRAGMYTIAAGYGYIEAGDSAAAWGADLQVDDSRELPGLILQLIDRH